MVRKFQRRISKLVLLILTLGCGSSSVVLGESAQGGQYNAQVNRDYIDVRTGPGRGYPVHQIVQEGEKLELIKQKTNWIYVESERGVDGWLHSSELPNMVTNDGAPYRAGVADRLPEDGYFEFGMQAGDFGGSQLLAVSGSYAFTPQISMELALAEAIGNFSTTYYFGYQAMHFAPEYRGYRPYFILGAGRAFVKASARIVQPEDLDDDFLKAGFGIRKHIDGRFYLKFEYGSYLVLRSQDDNDEISEWKLGISSVF